MPAPVFSPAAAASRAPSAMAARIAPERTPMQAQTMRPSPFTPPLCRAAREQGASLLSTEGFGSEEADKPVARREQTASRQHQAVGETAALYPCLAKRPARDIAHLDPLARRVGRRCKSVDVRRRILRGQTGELIEPAFLNAGGTGIRLVNFSRGGSGALAPSTGERPVRVMVCHWSRRRPLFSVSGKAPCRFAGTGDADATKRARPDGMGKRPSPNRRGVPPDAFTGHWIGASTS